MLTSEVTLAMKFTAWAQKDLRKSQQYLNVLGERVGCFVSALTQERLASYTQRKQEMHKIRL